MKVWKWVLHQTVARRYTNVKPPFVLHGNRQSCFFKGCKTHCSLVQWVPNLKATYHVITENQAFAETNQKRHEIARNTKKDLVTKTHLTRIAASVELLLCYLVMLSSCKGRVLTFASIPFYLQMTGLHMIIRKPLPCKQNFLSLLLIKRVSVSGIHVGSLCSFYKRNSSSVNITKLCGLDGLSSKIIILWWAFTWVVFAWQARRSKTYYSSYFLPISLLPCSSTICERTGFNSLSILVQIICPETTGNFYSLKPSWKERGLISRTTPGNRA